MDDLKTFFKTNEVKIGRDYIVGTPLYYDSLRSAFSHYFSTFLDQKNVLHLTIETNDWTKETFSSAVLHYNLSQSILSFHRFFELFIKDVLRSINPYLAVKFLEKEEELFLFFDGNLSADQIKTIEFAESLKRLKQAFKSLDKESELYIEKLKKWEFINEKKAIAALDILSDWRNRIMHNGNTYPNQFAYEYLITQEIIPLIKTIMDLEKRAIDFEPHYFVTPTGIDLITSLKDVKFDYKDGSNRRKRNEIGDILLYINHLKELGRASMTQDFYRRDNKDYKELDYKNPKERAERFAEAERNHSEFYSLNTCNCCGVKSQVVYRRIYWNLFRKCDDFKSWLRCFNCDYSVGSNIGDPFIFSLSDKRIFPIDMA